MLSFLGRKCYSCSINQRDINYGRNIQYISFWTVSIIVLSLKFRDHVALGCQMLDKGDINYTKRQGGEGEREGEILFLKD